MAKETLTPEETTEQTKGQNPKGNAIVGFNLTAGDKGPQIKAPPGGTYKTYDLMSKNPTLALARAITKVPIRTANVTLGSIEGTPEDRVEFIQSQFGSWYSRLVVDMLWALENGYSPFEKVFVRMPNGLIGYEKIKWLVPGNTTVLIEQNGDLGGLKQGQVIIPKSKAFVFVNEMQGANWYGISRHENVRTTAWDPWEKLSARLQQYAKKVAAIIPMISYPVGESKDANGTLVSNFKLAQANVRSLFEAEGIAIPNDLSKFADEVIRSGGDPEKWEQWKIKVLEIKGNHMGELISGMKHLESLMLRGWLVPERTATEGQFGTKAESETHGALAAMIASLTLADILIAINKDIINPLLCVNYGLEAADSVFAESKGIDPLTMSFFRVIVEKIVTDKDNVGLMLETVDFDLLVAQSGLPMNPDDLVKINVVAGDDDKGDDDDAVELSLGYYSKSVQRARRAIAGIWRT